MKILKTLLATILVILFISSTAWTFETSIAESFYDINKPAPVDNKSNFNTTKNEIQYNAEHIASVESVSNNLQITMLRTVDIYDSTQPVVKYNSSGIGNSETTQHFCNNNDCDNDGYVSIDAGGNDCHDQNPQVHPGVTIFFNTPYTTQHNEQQTSFDYNCDGDEEKIYANANILEEVDFTIDAVSCTTNAEGWIFQEPACGNYGAYAPIGVSVPNVDNHCDLIFDISQQCR